MANTTIFENSSCWEVRGAMGISCLLATFVLISELLCNHRAYKTTLQRLILYYTLLSLVYQVLTCINAMVQNHTDNSVSLLRMAMYFADAAFLLPAVIINYLTYMVLKLGFGHRLAQPRDQPKQYTILTETVCVVVALAFSLVWVIFNVTLNKHFSFDVFYTTQASGLSFNHTHSDKESIAAQAGVSAVIIGEMVVAVTVLNVAHWKIRRHVRGDKVLALERKTHIIVIAVALIYVVGLTLSFGLEQLTTESNGVTIFFALCFPLLNQCNLFILFVTSIWTTNHPLFCLQRKNIQSHQTDLQQTNPSSHPFEQPSHTTFHPPYTGAFTTITDTSGVYCEESVTSSNIDESTPLLSDKQLLNNDPNYANHAQGST